MLENVKLLLNLTDDLSDNLLLFFIDKVTQTILNYCNIKELPNELIFVATSMVVDLYRENRTINNLNTIISKEDTDIGNSAVSSVSEQGRTVSFDTAHSDFANNVTKANLLKLTIEERVSNIKELQQFRLLYR